MAVRLIDKYARGFIDEKLLAEYTQKVIEADKILDSRTGKGSEMLGWVDLPVSYDREEFARIKKAAEKIKKDSDILIVIGIGGSYLGARAVIEFIKSQNYNDIRKGTPAIYFSGNSISSDALSELIEICEGRDFSVNVISKSGTTTEPAVAFRIFKKLLIDKYGKEKAAERIYVTTDKEKGTLKHLADEEGFETFVVPDDVGGRFSVLTAVGLLPIAVSGADIDALMLGAEKARRELSVKDYENNPVYKYAAMRNALYKMGKKTEMFISYEPRFTMMNEWLKQLFGESEGKENKGLFPSSAVFSTDLHSLGQYIQQGERIQFETVFFFTNSKKEVIIGEEEGNPDSLNFLSGKPLSFVNRKAFEGTVIAHVDGGVPNIIIEADEMNEENLGWLIYFFEKAVAVSGYVIGVNPFDQPGVEKYKKNMFALLGKPGYEEMTAELEKRIKG